MNKNLKIIATAAGTVGALLFAAVPAQAATNNSGYTYTGATSVKGTQVSFASSVKANRSTTVKRLGICIRDSRGRNLDLPATNRGNNVQLTRTAKKLTGTKTFQPGTYKYGVCFYTHGGWRGEPLTGMKARSFTVKKPSNNTPTPTPTPTTPPTQTPTPTAPPTTQPNPPADSSMPVGNVVSDGKTWVPVMSEDFKTTAGLGQVQNIYKNTFPMYPEGTGNGKYLPNETTTVHDSLLDINVHHVGNVDAGAAGQFIQQNGEWAYTGGRFSIRFRATGNPEGYGAAFILWPYNQNWSEGEIDFPEGELTSGTNLNQHRVGANPEQKSLMLGNVSNWSDWHTATIEWVPGKTLKYYMDGKIIAQETNPANVPTTMHTWVVQTAAVDESTNGAPDSSNGHLLIDWAVAYQAK